MGDNTERCEDVWNDYICHCKEGYIGPLCDMDFDECSQFVPVCENGDCTNLDGSYECDCYEGYTGKTAMKILTNAMLITHATVGNVPTLQGLTTVTVFLGGLDRIVRKISTSAHSIFAR